MGGTREIVAVAEVTSNGRGRTTEEAIVVVVMAIEVVTISLVAVSEEAMTEVTSRRDPTIKDPPVRTHLKSKPGVTGTAIAPRETMAGGAAVDMAEVVAMVETEVAT